MKESYTQKQSSYILPFTLVILVGIVLRLFGLGDLPLNEAEARNANAALASLHGSQDFSATQPLYLGLTALIFKLFTANEFYARLVPALFGIALLFLPLCLDEQRLTMKAKLIATAFLAFDPALIAYSKQADETILAVTCAAFLFIALRKAKPVLTVLCCAGLLAAIGRSLPGVLAFAIAATITEFMDATFFDGSHELELGRTVRSFIKFRPRSIILIIVITLLLVIGFYAHPFGLAAFGNGLLSSFSDRSILLPFPVLFVLALTYYGLPIVFTIRALTSKQMRRTNAGVTLDAVRIVLFAIALLLFRQGVLTFVWLAPFVALLSARMVEKLLPERRNPTLVIEHVLRWLPVVTLLILTVSAAVLIRQIDQTAALTTPLVVFGHSLPINQIQLFFWVALLVFASLVFLIPSLLDTVFHFDYRKALTEGFLLGVTFVMLQNAWEVAGFSRDRDNPVTARTPVEIRPILGTRAVTETDVLLTEARLAGVQAVGTEIGANGMVTIADDPALRWALRDFRNTIFTPYPIAEPSAVPDFYLTADEEPTLLANYSAIGIPIRSYLNVDTLSDVDWLKWIVYRDLPVETETAFFWKKNRFLY